MKCKKGVVVGLSVKKGASSKHGEIVKGCPDYISFVVEVSSCSNQKTFGQKLIFFQDLIFLVLFVIEFSVLSELNYFSFVTI